MSRNSNKKAISFLKGMIIFLIGIVVGLLLLTAILNIGDKKEATSDHTINNIDQVESDVANRTTEATQQITTEAYSEQPATEAPAATPDDAAAPVDQNADPDVEAILDKMSLHEKVCQLFVVTPEALTGYAQVTEFGDTSKQSFDQYPVGGIAYFSQNLESNEQTKAMLTGIQNYAKEKSGFPILLTVDEEGGTVARCAEKLNVPKIESMYNYKDQGTEKAYENSSTIAKYLKDLGFNMDCAPVADTWSNPSNTVIGKRAYSDNYQQTAELVGSAVKGYEDNGIISCLKHFPGHGNTAEDSHTSTATTDKSIDQLRTEEYLPFQSGINSGCDVVMVGHITVTSISNDPATVSKDIVTGELRGKLGFNGVVITDALNMGAIANKYSSSGELAIKCIEAGDDMLLMINDFKSAEAAVEEAVKNGTISEERINESVRRILKLKLSMK